MTSAKFFRMQYIPVLWGGNRQALRVARRLFFRYGTVSHMFGTQFSFVCRHTPWLVCHKLPLEASPTIATLALTEFATEAESRDRIPLLFLFNEAPSCITPEQRSALETKYILCHAGDEQLFPNSVLTK